VARTIRGDAITSLGGAHDRRGSRGQSCCPQLGERREPVRHHHRRMRQGAEWAGLLDDAIPRRHVSHAHRAVVLPAAPAARRQLRIARNGREGRRDQRKAEHQHQHGCECASHEVQFLGPGGNDSRVTISKKLLAKRYQQKTSSETDPSANRFSLVVSGYLPDSTASGSHLLASCLMLPASR